MIPSELRREPLRVFGLELEFHATVVLVAGTLLLSLDYYFRFIPAEGYAALLRAKAAERVIYYLLAPLIVILVVFRQPPRAYGLKLGNWRRGLAWSAASLVLSAPVLYFASQAPSMVSYYAQGSRPWFEVLWVSGLDLLGWEFFFRGFLLFGLAPLAGPTAILLQAVPFALAHLGKPALETFTTLFGGAYFGWIAWRTRSFVYAFLIHWAINVFVILASSGVFGSGA